MTRRAQRSGIARIVAIAAALTILPRVARAGDPVRVSLAEGSACTDKATLERRLAARGVTIDGATDASVVDVTIGATDTGVSARFVVRRAGRESTRDLVAPSCEDAIDALSFAIALALEDAALPPAPAPAPAPAPPTAPEPAPAPAPAPAPPPPPPPPAGEPGAIAFSFGAKLGASLGSAPDPTGHVVFHADLGSTRASGFSPFASLGASIVFADASTAQATPIDVASQHGHAELCPVRFGSDTFGLRPCARLEIGRIQARANGFVGARLEDRVWAAAGPGVRARLHVTRRFFLEAELHVVVPLLRDTFFVNGSEAFTVPAGAGRAAIGGGLDFR